MKVLVTLMAGIAMAGCISMAAADQWKDESGHGKWQGRYQDEDDYERKRERYSYKKEFRRAIARLSASGRAMNTRKR